LTPPETGRVFPAEVLVHAVRPEAAADIIAFLVSDRAAPVTGAVVSACGRLARPHHTLHLPCI
jgi:NAD(P)-dependent dehydrogenase (short-subunit alcohol dehydrogenase family)